MKALCSEYPDLAEMWLMEIVNKTQKQLIAEAVIYDEGREVACSVGAFMLSQNGSNGLAEKVGYC
ncbi:MAG: hypothetical protein L3J79_01265 [Candidatus Marinimicrobia bacterium]|nr:hypothetical protein [Candidatus Neomarinimicrobiota bacterium]